MRHSQQAIAQMGKLLIKKKNNFVYEVNKN